MKIFFERTGGFANLRFTGNFDLDSLPEETADPLRTLLEQMDFPSLPEQLFGTTAVPDQFNYRITVTTPSGQHTVTTGENSAPALLGMLLQRLTELARAQAMKK